jgi:hypothetical protein
MLLHKFNDSITYFLNIPTRHHSMAVNLSKMKAIRDAFHRTPCAPDSDRYLQFEKSFTFDPTEDQKSCFQVSNFFTPFFILFAFVMSSYFSFIYSFCYIITITTFNFALPLIPSLLKIIASDMINNTRPMDRLVCGDVGFGKTEVAIRAIYRAVLSKKQVRS